MLRFYLATLVLEKKITLDQAEKIREEIGNKVLPETIKAIVYELQEYFK